MIGYLEGKLLKKESDKILLLAGHVGYEVMLPGIVMKTLNDKIIDDFVSLYIYYVQTERQPKPVLIGFNRESEKTFFQHFISVEGMGPLKASKALDIPLQEIAVAIENSDVSKLTCLKGVGKRMAQKIIASLEGKMTSFILPGTINEKTTVLIEDYAEQVSGVLVAQLGYRSSDAKKLIADALKRNPSINSSEELFDEVYGGVNESGKSK
ncbi:MAG: Holliday junction DNA helicase RuvA [Desulfobacteraceae bacterium 4572_19]|nr:MAG: Holliday junction DNA helicase RuvA [Desulfobacteraceae bacterium 4572_19]